jgi:alpha/beta superfamily hydrolase
LPVSASELSGAADCHKPKLIVQGSLDQFSMIEDMARFFAGLGEPKRLVIIPGADHSFAGYLGELAKAVSQFAAQ